MTEYEELRKRVSTGESELRTDITIAIIIANHMEYALLLQREFIEDVGRRYKKTQEWTDFCNSFGKKTD